MHPERHILRWRYWGKLALPLIRRPLISSAPFYFLSSKTSTFKGHLNFSRSTSSSIRLEHEVNTTSINSIIASSGQIWKAENRFAHRCSTLHWQQKVQIYSCVVSRSGPQNKLLQCCSLTLGVLRVCLVFLRTVCFAQINKTVTFFPVNWRYHQRARDSTQLWELCSETSEIQLRCTRGLQAGPRNEVP